MMRKTWQRATIILVLVFTIGFSIYLRHLYQDLEVLFNQRTEFLPTRIFSDVEKIEIGETKKSVLQKLDSLQYKLNDSKEESFFLLRSAEFPLHLLPDGSPAEQAFGKKVHLEFEVLENGVSFLQRISIHELELDLQEVYLEPKLIATLGQSSGDSQIREWVPFEEIPAPIWQAVLSVEDQHFLDHSGFDPRGIARAIFVNLKTLSFSQGGSTITQQLVKNLTARRTKNLWKKFNELFLAILLELRVSKEKILERYLNEVYLGQIGNYAVHGVSEGAKYYFGKNLEDLTLSETTILAGLIKGPGVYSPFRSPERARERQKWVLEKMLELHFISEEQAKLAIQEPMRLATLSTSTNLAPYYVDQVKLRLLESMKEKFPESEIFGLGLRVYTALNPRLQELAQHETEEWIKKLEARKSSEDTRLEGAVVILDHQKGLIRALVGGRNYQSTSYNRILNMKRQAGSTFKPFVYLAAYSDGSDEEGTPFGPLYPIEDAPWTYEFDRGRQTWSPKNYDRDFRGWITLKEAMVNSLNVPTAKLATKTGIQTILAWADLFGFQGPIPEVPSISLGSFEVSPMELANAYATLANLGMEKELTTVRAVSDHDGNSIARFEHESIQVAPRGLVELIRDSLQEVFRTGTARQAKNMGWARPSAGKTGTTSDYRDSWFVGFTPEYTTLTWVGYDQIPKEVLESKKKKSALLELTGAGTALPLWISIMKGALSEEPIHLFSEPTELEVLEIDLYSGKKADLYCDSSHVQRGLYWRERTPPRGCKLSY